MDTRQILQLLNNDLRNEWKHLRFYLYHASAVIGLHSEEYKELFLEEAASEMKHVTAFSDLIIGMGGVATSKSNSFPKFVQPLQIMNYAVRMEEQVVGNYVTRMQDAIDLGGVDGQWLEIFLEGQIQDSRQDVDRFHQIVKDF